MTALLLAAVPTDRWSFIWGAYAVFAVIFLVLILVPIFRRRRIVKDLRHYYRRKALIDDNQEN